MAATKSNDAAAASTALTTTQKAVLTDLFMLAANTGLPRTTWVLAFHPTEEGRYAVERVAAPSAVTSLYADGYLGQARIPAPARRVEECFAHGLTAFRNDRSFLAAAMSMVHVAVDKSMADMGAVPTACVDDPHLSFILGSMVHALRRGVREAMLTAAREASTASTARIEQVVESVWVQRLLQVMDGLVIATMRQMAHFDMGEDAVQRMLECLTRFGSLCIAVQFDGDRDQSQTE